MATISQLTYLLTYFGGYQPYLWNGRSYSRQILHTSRLHVYQVLAFG